jgi:hypothetical protein
MQIYFSSAQTDAYIFYFKENQANSLEGAQLIVGKEIQKKSSTNPLK